MGKKNLFPKCCHVSTETCEPERNEDIKINGVFPLGIC